MRFEVKYNNATEGDTRIVTKFLLFPLTIGKEMRWLESAKIKQRYDGGWFGWENESFI